MPSRNRSFAAVGMAVCLTLAWGAARDAATETRRGTGQELKVLSRHTVPAKGTSAPMDIRWAGDNSVFVAYSLEGVVELELASPPRELRFPVPDVKTLKGPRRYWNLAVSSRLFAVASDSLAMAWRPAAVQKTGAVGFFSESVLTPLDIDLSGDRLVLLGDGRPKMPEPANEEGGIAHLGRLSATGVKGLRPVLFEADGKMQSFYDCSPELGLGAVRFLPGGAFVVVPGFLPGAYLFDADGNRVHTWSQEETGLTTDCTRFTRQEGERMRHLDLAELTAWLSRHRVLDDILPLEEGPGLLIRSVDSGVTSWELRILTRNGDINTYQLPLKGGPEDRLSGDLRNGRIVLLRGSFFPLTNAPQRRTSEILTLQAPQAASR